jgi:AcrR family transcriptional regulator
MASSGQDVTVKKGDWPPWARPLLNVVGRSVSISAAAERVQVSRPTIYRLRARDSVFAAALDEAREAGLDLLEERLYLAATSGIPNRTVTTRKLRDGTVVETVKEGVDFYPTAGMFLLKRWRPQYRENYRAEATGADDGPIQIESIERIDAQIAMLTAELARRDQRVTPRDLAEPELDDGDCDVD